MSNDDVLNEIKKSYTNRKRPLIPFIGAGFSKNAQFQEGSKSPDWKEFVEYLSGTVSLNDRQKEYLKTVADPMLATEYCIATQIADLKTNVKWTNECKKKLGKIVTDYFNTLILENPENVSDVHITLVKKFNTIYTSNWDELLEKALDNHIGKNNYNVYYNYDKFLKKDIDHSKNKLIKIHGCVKDSPEYKSLIATRSTYYNSMLYKYPMYVKFQHDIAFNDFVFIGFSFADQNITYLLQEISDMKTRTLKNKNHKIFFVSTDDYDQIQYRLFKNSFGVDVYYCEVDQLNSFLNSL